MNQFTHSLGLLAHGLSLTPLYTQRRPNADSADIYTSGIRTHDSSVKLQVTHDSTQCAISAEQGLIRPKEYII